MSPNDDRVELFSIAAISRKMREVPSTHVFWISLSEFPWRMNKSFLLFTGKGKFWIFLSYPLRGTSVTRIFMKNRKNDARLRDFEHNSFTFNESISDFVSTCYWHHNLHFDTKTNCVACAWKIWELVKRDRFWTANVRVCRSRGTKAISDKNRPPMFAFGIFFTEISQKQKDTHWKVGIWNFIQRQEWKKYMQ